MATIGRLVLSLLNIVLSGFVTSLLWLWFFVPLGVSPITIVQAIGITFTIRIMAQGIETPDESWFMQQNIDPKNGKPVSRLIIYITILTIGWLIQLFL
jgi:hypothetical protein